VAFVQLVERLPASIMYQAIDQLSIGLYDASAASVFLCMSVRCELKGWARGVGRAVQ
jgi:hypothetical protein